MTNETQDAIAMIMKKQITLKERRTSIFQNLKKRNEEAVEPVQTEENVVECLIIEGPLYSDEDIVDEDSTESDVLEDEIPLLAIPEADEDREFSAR